MGKKLKECTSFLNSSYGVSYNFSCKLNFSVEFPEQKMFGNLLFFLWSNNIIGC